MARDVKKSKKKRKKKPGVVSPDKKPTRKEQAFIDHYCTNGFNALKAMKSAKYKGSDNTLSVTAHRLLKKPNILKRIDEYQKRERDKLNATKEEKLRLLTEIMRNKDCVVLPPKYEGGEDEVLPAVPYKDRINAIKEHNAMEGHHSETKFRHKHSIGNDVLDEVKKQVASDPELQAKIENELRD